MPLAPREAFWDISDYANSIINCVAEIRKANIPDKHKRRLSDILDTIVIDAQTIKSKAEEKGY